MQHRTKLIIASGIFIILPVLALAQEFEYPVLLKTGTSIEDFIPAGWHLLGDTAMGDLNEDGILDFAFAIQKNDTIPLTRRFYEQSIIEEGRPRILIIIYGSDHGVLTVGAQANHALLLEDEGGAMGDPYWGVSIDSGMVKSHHLGGGGWFRWSIDYWYAVYENAWAIVRCSNYHLEADNHKGVIDDYDLINQRIVRTVFDDLYPQCEPCDDCEKCDACDTCPEPCTRCFVPTETVTVRQLKNVPLPLLEDFEPLTIQIGEDDWL